MNYRAVTVVAVTSLGAGGAALARCFAPAWYHAVITLAAVGAGGVFAVLLARADPKVAAQAMANAREAQETLRGFLAYRGLSTGITPVTATSESLRDAVSSPVSLSLMFAFGVIFSVMNSENLFLSCATLTPKSWGSLFGELVTWTFFGQGMALACWNLVKGRKK